MDHLHQEQEQENNIDEIEIPSYFLCPISMEIMKDPVTISTGITYDRDSIERWIATAAGTIRNSNTSTTCPVTKQPLTTNDFTELTPNHTLRRLIQYWCTLNASHGIQRIPTPKPPVSISHISKIISRTSSQTLSSLQELRSIALQSLANRRIIRQAPGIFDFLSSVIIDGHEDVTAVDLALSVLHHLTSSGTSSAAITSSSDPHPRFPFHVVQSLTNVLTRNTSNDESRTFALELLKLTLEPADPRQLATLKPEFFTAMVKILTDGGMPLKSQKDALKLLIHACPWGRNRIAAVEAKAVWALVNILIDGPGPNNDRRRPDRRIGEMAMVVLDQLSGCAEGRADLLTHGAGLAVVSKKILRISHLATEKAVRILSSVARLSNPSVVKEMLEVGVVAKLCLLMQVEFYDGKVKENAREILRLHSRVWKDHPCLPSALVASYPSC